jgi:outer membrane protein OmpA-like peptidoglycan-associated protein
MKKQIIIGLSLLICGMIPAQQTGSYFHFNVGGGLNALSYKLLDGTQQGQAGYALNAAYSYFFTPQWGIQTGIGLQSFSSLSTQNYLSKSPDVDTDGQTYEFRSNYKNWQEKQQVIFIDIPLELQYKYTINKKVGIIASAGASISFPVSASYKTSGGTLTTTGYYSQWNVELSNMPQHGFSTFTDFKGNLILKPAYMGIVDLGGLYKLSEKVDVYLGGYFNYGLNNVVTPDTKLMFQPNGTYNGVFASSQTSEVKPFSVGVKIGVYLKMCKNKMITPVVSMPTETIKASEPVKAVAPAVVEPQKNVFVEQPAVPVIKRDTVQVEDPLLKAKRIAATIVANFKFKSDQIGNSEDNKIQVLSDILKAYSDIRLYITGHTDDIGSHEVNLRYGMRRANSMKQKYIDQGVSESQLVTQSKAYDEPLVPNTSKANRAKNRRVELKVFRLK